MTEMLQSIKSDLLSRRLLPLLALLGVALVAALAYALTGGSSSGSVPSARVSSAPVASGPAPLAVSVASANPHEAVSETPGGSRYQSQGPTRNPFTPLPSPPAAKSAGSHQSSVSAEKSGGHSSAGPPSSGGSSGSTGGSAPAAPAPSKSSKPTPTQPTYTVTVQFGLVPATPTQAPSLTSYANLKPQTQLPSKQDVRIIFERVSNSGKGAIFKFVVPPILHGKGQCLPSTSECEAIDLAAGQSEELEYTEASGQVAVYELEVVSIAKAGSTASTARVGRKIATQVQRGTATQARRGTAGVAGRK